MSNIFSMVTLRRSNNYTVRALESFFTNTIIEDGDEFLLIDNDGCDIDKFSSYEKIKIIKNRLPLSFAKNVNQAIEEAKRKKKDLIFINNDVVFTKKWLEPIKLNSESISIPVNNQIFPYKSDCGNLKLDVTMSLNDFADKNLLLEEIAKRHHAKYSNFQKFQGLLMPFFCFKVPYKILNDVGLFDVSFVEGAEDVDYRIRCAIKGYDVNFIINSYLLHFHGKSTWDGGETQDQTNKRNQLYIENFLKKWGEEITQVFIIRNNFLDILEKKGLTEIYKKGQFGELIRRLVN